MVWLLLFGLVLCLLSAIGITSVGWSDGLVKIVSVISICALIGCVWWLK